MGYVRTPRRGANGLGYSFTVDYGIGKQKVSVPIEQMVQDASAMAVQQIHAGMNEAAGAAVGVLKGKMPEIAEAVMPIMKTKVLPPLLAQVTDTAVNKLWPQMQPKVRTEVIFAGAVLAAAMLVPLAVSTLYLRREIRRGRSGG